MLTTFIQIFLQPFLGYRKNSYGLAVCLSLFILIVYQSMLLYRYKDFLLNRPSTYEKFCPSPQQTTYYPSFDYMISDTILFVVLTLVEIHIM